MNGWGEEENNSPVSPSGKRRTTVALGVGLLCPTASSQAIADPISFWVRRMGADEVARDPTPIHDSKLVGVVNFFPLSLRADKLCGPSLGFIYQFPACRSTQKEEELR